MSVYDICNKCLDKGNVSDADLRELTRLLNADKIEKRDIATWQRFADEFWKDGRVSDLSRKFLEVFKNKFV